MRGVRLRVQTCRQGFASPIDRDTLLANRARRATLRVTWLTKSWASGEKGTEAIERLRMQIAELERKQGELLGRNGRRVFDWASFALGSSAAPDSMKDLRDHPASQEVREIIALYDQLNQQLLDKEAVLNEKLDEQARSDSLG